MTELTDTTPTGSPMPTLYLGHGAPPLLEEADWMAQFRAWTSGLPTPKAILIVSAHWSRRR